MINIPARVALSASTCTLQLPANSRRKAAFTARLEQIDARPSLTKLDLRCTLVAGLFDPQFATLPTTSEFTVGQRVSAVRHELVAPTRPSSAGAAPILPRRRQHGQDSRYRAPGHTLS